MFGYWRIKRQIVRNPEAIEWNRRAVESAMKQRRINQRQRRELLAMIDKSEKLPILRSWWEKYVQNGWAFHGTSSLYLSHIKKNGLDPAERPFHKQVMAFHSIAQRFPHLIEGTYLTLAYGPGRPDYHKHMFFTTHYDIALTHAKEKGIGEEFLGIAQAAQKILKAHSTDERVRDKVSEDEISFVKNILAWITEASAQARPFMVKVRLSHPAFEAPFCYLTGCDGGPIYLGSFERFEKFFDDMSLDKVKRKLSEAPIPGLREMQIQKRILPEELEITGV